MNCTGLFGLGLDGKGCLPEITLAKPSSKCNEIARRNLNLMVDNQ